MIKEEGLEGRRGDMGTLRVGVHQFRGDGMFQAGSQETGYVIWQDCLPYEGDQERTTATFLLGCDPPPFPYLQPPLISTFTTIDNLKTCVAR